VQNKAVGKRKMAILKPKVGGDIEKTALAESGHRIVSRERGRKQGFFVVLRRYFSILIAGPPGRKTGR
jgi:hypothetical protein